MRRAFLAVALAVGRPAAADGGVPERVLPTAEPDAVYTAYADFARERGRSGAALVPVCRQLVEKLNLCFGYEVGGTRRLVTESELLAWDTTPAALEAVARRTTEGAAAAGIYQEMRVEGMAGRYWVGGNGDGRVAAALLHPEDLAAIAGAEPVVGVPERDTLLFWVPGDPDFDKVLAVGVRRLHDASEHPVSPLVYRWDGERWTVWGEAR